MAADHSGDVFHHVRDANYFELPFGNHVELPLIKLGFYNFQLTKFMVLQVVAGLLTLLIFFGLARHIRAGRPARGWFWNFWEMLAVAIRDDVVRPAIGTGHHHDDVSHGEAHHGDEQHVHGHDHSVSHQEHLTDGYPKLADDGLGEHSHGLGTTGSHPADKYLPFIWSCFFYVLFCNLLGAFPWLGSATGEINVTAALALVTFGYVVVAGSEKLGVAGFWQALVPSMDVPGAMGLVLKPMIWVIEFVGLFIKHGVLAVRLFANIMAGHTVIAVILGYIAFAATDLPNLYWLITPASVLGQLGIGMLELFVAFLQAYVFAFLASLFIGAAVHPH